jgi:glutamate-1-semialdehyde 2,1-aminomutase
MGEVTTRANSDLLSAVADAEAAYVAANPESARLAALAAMTMPGGNTRTTLHYTPFPLHIRRARGSRVTDVDGHDYADFINEHTAGLFGHSNPVIQAAIRTALDDGITLGAPSIYDHRLAAEVKKRFPAMERLRFCNSGTEANLLAIATARAVTGRPGLMVFAGGYHGGMLYFGHGASPINMPFPVVVSRYNDTERALADLRAHAPELAAVIVEPMQGAAGALPAEPGFLHALQAACEAQGVLMIVDEVMTSRLGPGGLTGRLGLDPDLVTLGKYIGGGLTIGCFGGRADVMDRYDPHRPGAIPHGGTFNNNVLAMAAGAAALSQVLTPERVEAVNALGDRLRERLQAAIERHGVAMVATGTGSIFGLHFHRGPLRNEAEADAFEQPRAAAIRELKKLFQLDLFAAGQYVTRRILGNLSIETSAAEVDGLVEAFDEFLASRGPLIRAALD